MPKPNKKSKPEMISNKESAYLMLPWTCKHYSDRSEIEAYVPGRDWETIAEVTANPGIDAELITGFIIRLANNHEKNHELTQQMAYALELCLTGGAKLTWEAEQEANVVLMRFKSGNF